MSLFTAPDTYHLLSRLVHSQVEGGEQLQGGASVEAHVYQSPHPEPL